MRAKPKTPAVENTTRGMVSGRGDEGSRPALLRAILPALPRCGSITAEPTLQIELPIADEPLDRESIRQALAPLLGVPVAEVSDARLEQVIGDVERSTTDRAHALAGYLACLTEHFQTIGCGPDQVEAYLRLAQQTLASLYLSAASSQPSPTELKQLALRYALDARHALEGRVERFVLTRRTDTWAVREYPSLALTMPAIPIPPRIVRDPVAVAILDHVFTGPPEIYRLLEFLELLLGGRPSRQDALPPARPPRFTYRLENRDGEPTVRLWVGTCQVELPKRRDVHRLLEVLCEKPACRLSGPQAREDHEIANPSEACKLIRTALQRARIGADQWLCTTPIQWAPGRAPKPGSRGSADRQ